MTAPLDHDALKEAIKQHLTVNVETKVDIDGDWEDGDCEMGISTTVQLLWDGEVIAESTSEENSVDVDYDEPIT